MAQRIAHERNLHIEIKHCSKSILMRIDNFPAHIIMQRSTSQHEPIIKNTL